jgi:hypothetical protein
MMPPEMTPLTLPATDPTPIFEHFRGEYATALLTAAFAEFRLFERLAAGPASVESLQSRLKLAERPLVVLLTALKAMGLLAEDDRQVQLTPLAREHLVPGGPFFMGDYIGLAAKSPGVQEMIARLKTNRPAGADDQGAAFIFREGVASAMERETTARHFTLALAGRAKNVAPVLAEKLPLEGMNCLLDVGGGTGIYSIALLRKHPQLRAIVLDGPEVLKVTQEFAREYDVADRLSCLAGDMFADELPTQCEAILLSNILHDWDVPECQKLIEKCGAALPTGGRLLIHDVFLTDAHDGPLPIALYSAALFTLTEGRAYSAAEYRDWLTAAGLQPRPVIPTLVHCGVLTGVKT